MIFSLKNGFIYFLFGAVMTFLLMRGCSEPPRSETVYIKGETIRDTTYIYDTIQTEKPVPYRVTVYRTDLPDSLRPDPCDSVRDYRSGLDSAGIAIDVTSKVQGVLLSQAITYRLPQINSHRVDTLRITTERNYRYGLGVLTDGKQYEIIGQYGIARNVMLMGGYAPGGIVRVGAGVRF